MIIEKKSLISSLKATKKANVVTSAPATKEEVSTRKVRRMKKATKSTWIKASFDS
jgi:hypothetical protein